jgi:PAS domain S-box-containing protein/putative nucleotidyltransferase with HDIG domain
LLLNEIDYIYEVGNIRWRSVNRVSGHRHQGDPALEKKLIVSYVWEMEGQAMSKTLKKQDIGKQPEARATALWNRMSNNLKDQDIGKPSPGICTGAEELGLAGEAVRRAEIDYRVIFEAMGHATALIEDDLTITLANREFDKLSGYSREQIEGKKTLAEFLAPHDAREIRDYFSQRGENYNAPPKNYTILFTNQQGELAEAVVTLTMVPQLRKSILSLAEVRKLREAGESLKSSEARFRSLFENSPVGITLSHGDSLIYANPELLRMFGLDETTELQGKTFMNFVAPISRQMITERLERRMQGQDMYGPFEEEVICLRKDGTTFPVQIEAFRIDLHDGPASVTFISDITERKQAEDALKRESDINEALAELSSALISSKSIDEISDLVLDSARRLTGSEIGYDGYIEPETGHLICPTMNREILEMCRVPDKDIVFKEFAGLWGWALNNRKPLIINAPAEDPRSTGAPPAHLPIRHFLFAPAIYNGTLVGQIALANSDREYTQQDLKLIERLSELYATAINRKRSEDELECLASFSRLNPNPILDIDADGMVTFFNSSTLEVLKKAGLKEDARVFLPADLGVLLNALRNEEELRTLYREVKIQDRTFGEDIHLSEKHKVLRIYAFDITKRKQAEEALLESEEKYRMIFNATGTAAMILEEDTTISLINSEFETLSGYSKEDVEGKKSWQEFFTKDYLDDMIRYHNLRRVDPDFAPKEYETEFITRKGDVRQVIDTVSMIPGTNQSIVFLLDISGIKQAERATKQGEEKFRTLFEEAPVGVGISRAGNTLMANQAYLGMFAYASVTELEGTPLLDQIAPQCRTQVEAIARGEEQGKEAPRAYETVGLRKDGSQFPLYIEAARIELPDGPANIGYFTDITERKRAEEKLAESFTKLTKTFEQTVESLSSIVEMRDPYTAGHQVRVAKLACEIASELGMSEEQVNAIRTAALIHDIGKIIVPTEILNKPGKLSVLERSFVEAHAQASYEILKTIEFTLPIVDIVMQHHEKLDGSGYPQGLSGDSILKETRVLTVADIVEAMASHRPYRPALPLKMALEEISSHRGTRYDADVVDACLRLFLENGLSLSRLFGSP